MGQAQKSRQQGMGYRDVELELWDLDNSLNHRGSRNRAADRRNLSSSRNLAVDRRSSGSSRSSDKDSRMVTVIENRNNGNIRRYEQRDRRLDVVQTRSRRPERELQIQDIRKYQNSTAGSRQGTRSVYRDNARPAQSINRRRAKKRKVYLARAMSMTFIAACLILIYFMTGEIYKHMKSGQEDSKKGVVRTSFDMVSEKVSGKKVAPPEIIEDYLEVNDFSRPGTKISKVRNIFVHYTANPGTSAAQNRSYFANLALTQERSASAHLIIGYEGELIQCIPFDEQAYAVMTRNEDSISIECCYTSEDGSFTQETYDTLVHTLAWLTDEYDLSGEDILRHYDCGGKKCPIYYVEHEEAWERLIRDVEDYKDSGETDV